MEGVPPPLLPLLEGGRETDQPLRAAAGTVDVDNENTKVRVFCE